MDEDGGVYQAVQNLNPSGILGGSTYYYKESRWGVYTYLLAGEDIQRYYYWGRKPDQPDHTEFPSLKEAEKYARDV